MRIICWNCRGVGNPQAVNAMVDIVQYYKPSILFLMETKANGVRMEQIKSLLRFSHCFSVDCVGIGGGLCLMWKDDVKLAITGYCSNFIDSTSGDGSDCWRFTGFYGCPESGRRRTSWNLLRDLADRSQLPWLCSGDYNDIADPLEKVGGPLHCISLINGFRNALVDANLNDIQAVGSFLSYTYREGTDQCSKERLDRACSNTTWDARFPDAISSNLVAPVSDHTPLLIETVGTQVREDNRRFRFDNSWLEDDELGEVVLTSWQQGLGLDFIQRKDQLVKRVQYWGKNRNRMRWLQKERIKKRLGECSESLDTREVRQLKDVWNQILAEEDIRLRQQAKKFWFRHGDRNSKYFHNSIKARRRCNRIQQIVTSDGSLSSDVGTIQDAFLQYFSGLFSNSPTDFAELLPLVQPRIGAEDNVELLADFTNEEFRSALFQMDPNKAPGLDGLNPAFFQKYWPIIGVDVCNICRLWLARGTIPSEISSALIVLIPKCVNPVDVKDFRPIALYNVIYKILSKALANRLKRVLHKIISPNQSAFIPGRLITNNFIVAFETMHGLKLQNRGSVGSCALKIDIAKAYDRVEWSYLFAMLSALGFSDTWVGWMRMCFSNMSYYLAVNGAEIGPVVPSRGLRQGDPISPYLFLIVAEGLSLLIQDRENKGLLHGCCAKVGCPRVSHLFFADDSLLFFDGTVEEAIRIKQILGVYEKASGQAVNFDKSGIMFSPCVSEENRLTISGILDVHLLLGSGNYLGLPSLIGRSKKQIFSFLRDRIWKRISSWSNRFLSRAGREVLIKSVLQAIPTYCMNVFLLPVSTCRQLQVMMNKFWWGGCREDGRGMNWLSWDRMCGRKSEGGMGFRDLASFNTALLGKQGWRLLVDTNSLLYRVLKAKYFPNGDFLSARLGSNYSFVWKSILSSQQMLQHGVRWRIGDGKQVFVVNCPWIPRDIGFMPLDEAMFVPEAMRVCDLFVEGELRWDVEKLMNIFSVADMRAILTIPLPLFPKPDKLIWHLHKKGVYSVKSAYFCALELSGRTGVLGYNDGWNRLWSLDVPPKVRDFLWRTCRGVLPTRDILLRRGIHVPAACLFCDHDESISHVFLHCPMAVELWRLAGFSTAVDFSIFMDFFIHIYNTFGRERTARMAIHAWKLWHARNERLWVNKVLSPSEVHHAASSYFNDYVASLVSRPRTLSHPSVPRVLPLVEATTLEVDWIAFIDCAVFASADLFGFAAVFEDLEGFFSIAISGFYEGGGQPVIAEALALRQCLSYARDCFLQAGCIFTDNQSLALAIRSPLDDFSEFGLVVSDCKDVMRSQGNIHVCWVRRSENRVAHLLARESIHHGRFNIWIDIPDCLLNYYSTR
ncbi:uncharacterized protein LOC122724442 [Manihot esculenta]|uniref:uncharacterized protein LOC122724442 n=1 Tax=Manihot esculenta TaxID=3983 RepID=UPI001CC7DDBF|nr:uncharacterized protein LOC122724442 [Manihot esculenta]